MIPIPANLRANALMLPFKSTLFPIQKNLRKRVLDLCIATSIVTWEERIHAFGSQPWPSSLRWLSFGCLVLLI